MKKAYATFFMIMLAVSGAFAQAQVGLRLGANWATVVDGMDTPEGVEEPWRPGVVIGLASSFHLGENFAIAPEINYSQRGSKTEGTVNGVNMNSDARFNFLEVPVLFRLSFGETLKGYVNAGPTFSYWLGGKFDNTDIDFSVTDDEKRFELGASLGGGVQLNTGVGSFLIDLRYTRGFTDGIDNLTGDEQFKHQLISTSLIFLVPSIQ